MVVLLLLLGVGLREKNLASLFAACLIVFYGETSVSISSLLLSISLINLHLIRKIL